MKRAMKASGKMTQSQAYALIGEKTELKAKAVKGVVDALCEVATQEVKKSGVFAIPGIATLKLKTKKATKAGTRIIFGKETKVAAKPARKVVKAFPKKSFKEGCA
jgi:nucleoid DNA-binding protein